MDRPALTDGDQTPPRSSGSFGKLASGFLAVSLLSGAALVPIYDPSSPLPSLERIAGGIPWGWFLRGLHAYSSFLLLGSAAVHVGQVAWAKTERELSAGVWWRSVALVPLLVLALLGGFVLRGDAEARAAAEIWRALTRSIPYVGSDLSTLLLGTSLESLGAVALHHAGTLSILILLFTIEHGRKLWPGSRPATLAALVSIGAAGLLVLPLGGPVKDHGLLLGPWALLGLQGLLVDLPVVLGWILPAAFIILFGALRHIAGFPRTALLAVVSLGLLAYVAFTVRILLLAAGR